MYKIQTDIIEYNENQPVTIIYNLKVDSKVVCKHVNEKNEIPIAIQCANEGGYNSTIICAECVKELLE